MENNIILSICIPTYNGATSFLKTTLDILMPEVEKYNNQIEVIVSDNCSTDDTEVLLKTYSIYNSLKVYRNTVNVGFNGNMKLLLDKYASGLYSWMIGDDDVIIPDALSFIFEVLKKDVYDFISIKHKDISEVEINHLRFPENICYTLQGATFGESIDKNSQSGNTLGTFMSSNIFRTEIFRQVPKDKVVAGFDNFITIFPNAYLVVTGFADKKSCYIPEVSVYAVDNKKEWQTEDNIYLIQSKAFVDLYYYYLEMGVPKESLIRNYKRILFSNVLTGYVRLLKGKKVAPFFYRAVRDSYKYPLLKVKILSSLMKKILKISVVYND